jgi:putative DNA methylase
MADDRRLIEEWLPIAELGEESVRERRSMTALPPIYYLHVWWARRPLVASRAAVLASLLPANASRTAFLHTVGIHGDPVKTRRRIDMAKRTGEDLGLNPYGYPRAFTHLPNSEDRQSIESALGGEAFTILDPTAGGGSIPLESLRLGLDNRCKRVKPGRRANPDGDDRASDEIRFTCYQTSSAIVHEGYSFCKALNRGTKGCFHQSQRVVLQFLDIYTPAPFDCPYCGGLVPLSPNWKLSPVRRNRSASTACKRNGVGDSGRVCAIRDCSEIGRGALGRHHLGWRFPICPYPDCHRVIDGADRYQDLWRRSRFQMGEQLYAQSLYKRTRGHRPQEERRGLKSSGSRDFRAPRPEE